METEKIKIDYFGKMSDVMELVGEGDFNMMSFLRAEPVLKEIYDYVQDVPMYVDSLEQSKDFKKLFIDDCANKAERVKACWIDFLYKVTSAPTSVHVTGCVILQIPIIYELLQEYKEDNP